MKCHLLVGKRHGNLVARHIFARAVPARGRDCLVDLHTQRTTNNQAGLPLTGRPLLLAETKRFRTTLFPIDALFLFSCPLFYSRSLSLFLSFSSFFSFLSFFLHRHLLRRRNNNPSQCQDIFFKSLTMSRLRMFILILIYFLSQSDPQIFLIKCYVLSLL